MSASLFYLSCRSQEVGKSNASCLWSLHLLKRQKSKLQGNLKTTQNRHDPPPLQHSLFEKQSANNKWGNDYEKEEFITQETQTWVMTFTCIQVVTCIPSRVKVFQILSEENSFLPQRKDESLVILQLQLIHRKWWSQPRMKSAQCCGLQDSAFFKGFVQCLQYPCTMPTTSFMPSLTSWLILISAPI